MRQAAKILGELLTWMVIGLMVVLTTIVIVAVIYRKAGASLSWYDEVASVLLAWITYYGSALAALKRGHIGFDDVLLALPIPVRKVAVVAAEVLVLFFFALLAWAGYTVLTILQGETLVSLTWVPVSLTQSVIPIGAALFIVCELLSLPDYWRMVMAGHSTEHAVMAHDATPENTTRGGGHA
ncbi:TRAP transporter small permease [Jiella avicenniae]|uniref:TRAP transporter small permease protein n=1 Tax=Jiella avicenniae TaxID=2907202 RepID=A0A9X1P4B4_9HYPH|nr:TRAP transporter small permease subunit [Jiella avicenniae]